MKNKKKENSIRSLINLYTVVIGIALTFSVTEVLDPNKGLSSVTYSNLFLFFAFLVTLFPFFHGALRHLDDAYVENNNSHIKDGALIIDFILLFIHALAFVVLSLLINHPGSFGWVLAILFSIDFLWGIFVYCGSSSRNSGNPELKWAIINLCSAFLFYWYLVAYKIPFINTYESLELSLAIVGACVVRTFFDYMLCRNFYFPK